MHHLKLPQCWELSVLVTSQSCGESGILLIGLKAKIAELLITGLAAAFGLFLIETIIENALINALYTQKKCPNWGERLLKKKTKN